MEAGGRWWRRPEDKMSLLGRFCLEHRFQMGHKNFEGQLDSKAREEKWQNQ